MLWSFLYRALCRTFELLVLRMRSSERKELEILVLRRLRLRALQVDLLPPGPSAALAEQPGGLGQFVAHDRGRRATTCLMSVAPSGRRKQDQHEERYARGDHGSRRSRQASHQREKERDRACHQRWNYPPLQREVFPVVGWPTAKRCCLHESAPTFAKCWVRARYRRVWFGFAVVALVTQVG